MFRLNSHEENIEKAKLISKEIIKLMEVKGREYGNVYEKIGVISIFTRIFEKMHRFLNIEKNKIEIIETNEKKEETLKDLIAYCLLYLVNK